MPTTNYIVITSIHEPTEAVRAFSRFEGWTTVVVGDHRSPAGWHCPGVVFLSIEDQMRLCPELAALVPGNTYLRKMLGYLYAARNGATAIFETDDDNVPYDDARDTLARDLDADPGLGLAVGTASGWTNIYARFGAPQAWPRGLPLEFILGDEDSTECAEGLPWSVRQYLADGEPDVDAIFRLTRNQQVFFARHQQCRLQSGTFCPVNSQATLWRREAFPLMFLPLGVTDRVTDILRGYLATASLWSSGRTVSFASPVVRQTRNPHSLLKDFEDEIDLYRHADRWARLLRGLSGRDSAHAFSAAIDACIAAKALGPENREAYRIFRSQF